MALIGRPQGAYDWSGAFASAFAVGQIAALAATSSILRLGGTLDTALIGAGVVLGLSAWALRYRTRVASATR